MEKPKLESSRALPKLIIYLDTAMTILWHPRDHSKQDTLPGYSHIPFCTWAEAKGMELSYFDSPLDCWKTVCANCQISSERNESFKACARCKALHYCSKKCQVQHWKNGHTVNCKGHWIEDFFSETKRVRKVTRKS